MNSRILLYLHYNHENELSDYVIYQLEKMRSLFSRIYFISNSFLSAKNISRLGEKSLTDDVFLHKNDGGYDFKAWADAMKKIGFDALSDYDSVTIMNDTCFGPVFDFSETFEKFDQNPEIDFWGITNNRKQDALVHGKLVTFPDHIQSYFVSFKRRLVTSSAFREFWGKVTVEEDVTDIIAKYETQMTKHFEAAGYKSGVILDTLSLNISAMRMPDFTIFNLSMIVEERIPFIKKKAFFGYGEESDIQTAFAVLKNSNYPITFIDECLINYVHLLHKGNDAMVYKIRDYEEEVRNLEKIHTEKQEALQDLQAEINTMKASKSMRIGTALTAPVRLLRKLKIK